MEIGLIAIINLTTNITFIAHQVMHPSNLSSEKLQALEDKFIFYPVSVIVFTFLLFGTSVIVSRLGWEENGELKWGIGIIFPFIIGITIFVFSLFITGI